MSNTESTVAIDRASGIITCTLGRWYTGATCIVTIAINGDIDVRAGGAEVRDHEDRDVATREALRAVAKLVLGRSAS